MTQPPPSEPPKNRDHALLSREMRPVVEALLSDLEAAGHPFEMIEGHRTVERQAWLYASSRTRQGPKLTNCDGVKNPSPHQRGDGADLWPLTQGGHAWCPPATILVNGHNVLHPLWALLAEKAKGLGLKAGADFHDFDHVERRA